MPGGIRPLDAKPYPNKALRDTANRGSAISSAPHKDFAVSDPLLAKIIATWPKVPEAVRTAIVALVQAAVGPGDSTSRQCNMARNSGSDPARWRGELCA